MRKIKLNNNPTEEKTQERKPKLSSIAIASGTKPKNSKKRLKIAIAVVCLIFVLSALGFAAWRWNVQLSNSVNSNGERRSQACTDIFNPSCWTEAFSPQLEQVDGKTNALIIGIDTRDDARGAGLRNTDTIILATIDHESGHTRLISFPRDLYAPYGCSPDKLPYKSKINAIYAYGEGYCESKDGMKTLAYTIEEITGEKIQYMGLIRLEGAVETIDAVGGITVNVEDSFVDAYPYDELPPEYQQRCVRSRSLPAYCEFKYEAGENKFDGQQALIYSRMRQYSSDFARARRQQQVIEATKDKILSGDASTREKADNLFSVYQSLNDKVEADLSLEMILAGLKVATEVDTDPAKVVLDPNFGGGGLIVNGEGSNYNFRDYTFKQVQDKLKFIDANYDLYKEEGKIYAVNRTGSAWNNDNPMIKLKNENLWFQELVTNSADKDSAKSGVLIVDLTNGQKSKTVADLKRRFEGYQNVESVQAKDAVSADGKSIYTQSQHKEEIQVIIYSLEPKN